MRNIAKLIGTGLVGAAVVGLAVPAASAGERTGPAMDRAQVRSFPGESFSQYYGQRRGYYGGRGYGYGRRGYGGGALAAGVIGGLAVGALAGAAIAGSQPAPAYGYGGPGYGGPGQPVGNVYGHDPRWVNYCASRYRSFDAASGTYLAGDGNRYVCQ